MLIYFASDWMQIIAQGFGMRWGRDEELETQSGLLWLLAIGTDSGRRGRAAVQ